MESKKQRYIALILSFLSMVSMSSCMQSEERTVSLPDYSNKQLEYLFSGGLNNGWINHGVTNEKLYI